MYAQIARRTILMGVASALVAAPTPPISIGCQTNAWPVDPANFDSLLAVIGKIRDLGFAGFETGFRNVQSQADHAAFAREQISAFGLKFIGVHIFLAKYDPKTNIADADLYTKVAQNAAALGAQRLLLSGAPVNNKDDLARKAEGLNNAGAVARKLGLSLAYHNHSKEFANSGAEYDGLLRLTDPKLVGFLLDAGHAFRGGADVPALVEQNHRRFIGLHLRDFRDGKQVPLGAGDFPLAQVAAVLKKTGWEGWAIAEEEREDGSKPGDAAAGPAFAALRKQFA